jgi:hypothetical protein
VATGQEYRCPFSPPHLFQKNSGRLPLKPACLTNELILLFVPDEERRERSDSPFQRVSLLGLQAKFGLTSMAPQSQHTCPQVNQPSSSTLGVNKMAHQGQPISQHAKLPAGISSKKKRFSCPSCLKIYTIYAGFCRRPSCGYVRVIYACACRKSVIEKTISPPFAAEWPTVKQDDQFILST